ncbi:MAG TPA: 30S ribosome-binding factor RbfA [Methylomirabilota bacterium]|nr:30S ribosome-binding factor RbfA [Methylomirabilota bacterium]
MSRRTEKVAALLHKEVGEYLSRLELPVLTTISKVEVSPDLKHSKIWVTIMGNAEKQKVVIAELAENLSDLQHELNKKLIMKFVPRIFFVADHGEEYASHINELLRHANEE